MIKYPPREYEDKCRNCLHFDYQHFEWVAKDRVDIIIPCGEILETEYDKNLQTIMVLKRCHCNNYEPLDNLKYLEEQYAKRSTEAEETI
jgi:hypothetical protein